MAYAKHLWHGSEPCTEEQCEAGFTSGNLVLSVEHSKGWLRRWRVPQLCASRLQRGRDQASRRIDPCAAVESQVARVVKGAAKTCKLTAPAVANLSVASMFPGAK